LRMPSGNLLYLLQFVFAAVIGIYFWNLLRSQHAARQTRNSCRWTRSSKLFMPAWRPAKEFTARPKNK